MGTSWTMVAFVGQVDAARIASHLTVAAVVAVVTGVITAVVATHVLKSSQQQLAKTVSMLADTVAGVQQEISDLRVARSECETRSMTRFATHGEVGAILGQQIDNWQGVSQQLNTIHSRITDLAVKVAAIGGSAHPGAPVAVGAEGGPSA